MDTTMYFLFTGKNVSSNVCGMGVVDLDGLNKQNPSHKEVSLLYTNTSVCKYVFAWIGWIASFFLSLTAAGPFLVTAFSLFFFVSFLCWSSSHFSQSPWTNCAQ